jgi:thiamine-monophosphate kinase
MRSENRSTAILGNYQLSTDRPAVQIRELGERGLLELITPYCQNGAIGDDGAVVDLAVDRQLVVTTDVLVDGVHFSDRTTTGFDVGWRAVAANLSDLAAMGATPVGITVGLSLPGDRSVVWVQDLYTGMKACLDRYGTGILGGDLTRSGVATVAITALGQVATQGGIYRHTAEVGDAIVVTGDHGLAHVGLQLLLDRSVGAHLTSSEQELAILKHQQPQPRLDLLPLLTQISEGTRLTGMDSSDGLADALVQICRQSGVGARLDRSFISGQAIVTKFNPDRALNNILYGGEDFELVLTLPRDRATQLVADIGSGAAIIGEIVLEPGVVICAGGLGPDMRLDLSSSFQHFS